MKKQTLFMALAILAVVSLMSACKTKDPAEHTKTAISIAKQPEFRISSGDKVLLQTQGGIVRKAPAGASTLTCERVPYTWKNAVDIFERFQEFITPEGCFEDFLYVSNGEPFDLVMLYSNGGYRHLMGIYWYENGKRFEQQLWDEREDEKPNVWVNFNGTDSKGEISRKGDNAGAFTIRLPKDVKFGFYCHSLYNGNDIKEAIHTPLPYGPLVDYIYKFYTEKTLNWSYTVAEYDHYADYGLTTTQAMTTSLNDWTIVGFEDISITYPSCDRDYNDCVFAMNPQQRTDKEEPEPTPTPDYVEVNLSVNDEHEAGDYIATKLSIHVRSLTDVEVMLPIDKQYYCLADDMDISLSHREPNMEYNTDPQYVEMQIGSTMVTFTVQYEDDGIRVSTHGINQEVIDYCAANYSDGITFEVWNYFKDITRDELKPMLDESVVNFVQNPKLYINAFAKKRGYDGPVYSAANENGQLVPYTDEACTQPLDEQYWTRLSPDDKDYVFIGEQNPWDCAVEPQDASYHKLEPISTDPTVANFNVKYAL